MIVKKKILGPKGKSNRGRPRKEFKPKHKRLQEQVQPTTALVEHKMPTHERILRMPSKDKSIFYLFIFSIVLFLLSLTISFLKKSDVEELQKAQEEIAAVTWDTETAVVEDAKQPEIISNQSLTQIVENMYGTINSRSFDELGNYIDAGLENSTTIRTYFNTKRLTRFLNNIKDGTIAISNLQQEQLKEYSRKVTYTLTYTLLDNQTFEEQWNTTLIKRDEGYQVAAIKCETTGCSRMPFFNPGKFNIK